MLSVSNSANSISKSGTFVTKVSNEASASFDGTNDFIDASLLGSSGALSKTNGTISHWAKITTSANNEVLFSCSDGTSGNDKIQTVFMTATSSGQFQAVYKAGGTAFKAVYNFPAADIVSAGWFHLAMTYTIADEALVIKLYYNGALQNTFSGTAEPIGNSVDFDRVILGKNANADNSYLTGFMDEVVYYPIVLSDTQIEQIYLQKGITNFLNFSDDLSLPKLWLRMGDGSVEEVEDQTNGIVDMSNPTVDSDVIVNGDFSTSGSITTSSHTLGWSVGGSGDTGSSIVSNQLVLHRPVGEDHDHARIYASDGSSGRNVKPSDHQGKIYLLKLDIVSNTGSGNLQIFTGGAYVNLPDSTVGTKAFYFVSDNTQLFVMKMNTEGATLIIDNVSLKEVQGHPAFASGALINQDDNPTI